MSVDCCGEGAHFIQCAVGGGHHYIDVQDKTGQCYQQEIETCPFCGRDIIMPGFTAINSGEIAGKLKLLVDPGNWLLSHLHRLNNRDVTVDGEVYHVEVDHLDSYIMSNNDKLNPMNLVVTRSRKHELG